MGRHAGDDTRSARRAQRETGASWERFRGATAERFREVAGSPPLGDEGAPPWSDESFQTGRATGETVCERRAP